MNIDISERNCHASWNIRSVPGLIPALDGRSYTIIGIEPALTEVPIAIASNTTLTGPGKCREHIGA